MGLGFRVKRVGRLGFGVWEWGWGFRVSFRVRFRVVTLCLETLES